MHNITGNMWEIEADAKCITTNGTVKKNRACVMGRGNALEAKTLIPGIDSILGEAILAHGNRVILLEVLADGTKLFSFPVKHNWWERADLDLIARSAGELAEMADLLGLHKVILPRPGCGNGRLQWAYVEPILSSKLDGRIYCIALS